jgi:hypothetical protein
MGVTDWYEIGTGSGIMGAASFQHQGICKLISERPEVLLALIHAEPGEVVAEGIELLPGPETIREIRYPEHAVDTAVILRRTVDGKLVEALVTEVQLQPDDDKPWTWPIHVAGTRARLGCPTTLVVITDDERTARWAAEPIDLGRGRMVLRPIVIGPDRLPSDLDLEEARRQPELATLAVMMHGNKPGSKRLSTSTLAAVKEGLDNDAKRYSLLMDLITGCLDEATLRDLDGETKTMQAQSSVPIGWFARKHYFEGVAEGKEEGRVVGLQEGLEKGLQEGREQGRWEIKQEIFMKAIVLSLVSRGLVPTLAQLERMGRCTDGAQLEDWLRRAYGAASVEELLEPQRPASARRAGRRDRGTPELRAATDSARRSR